MEFLQPSLMCVWSFVTLFAYCESADNVSSQFDVINDTICETFPVEVQKTLPILMMIAQQQVKINGFGNLPFTRDMFRKVVNTGFSYFMILRQFNSPIRLDFEDFN